MLPAHRGNRGGQSARQGEYPLTQFRQAMDTLFNRFFGNWLTPFEEDFGNQRFWDFNVQENDKEIIVRAEMPGFEDKDLNVHINDNVLTIEAERREKSEGEQHYTRFYRTLTLPSGVDADKVQATYHNGVLELHVPRPEGAQPKRVQIQGRQGAPAQQGQQAATAQPAAQGKQEAAQPAGAGKEAKPAQAARK